MGSNCSIRCSAVEKKLCHSRRTCKSPSHYAKPKKVHAEVANWFGKHYEHLNIAAVSNLSTNSALLVEAGLGYALTIEGALPFLKESRIRMIPLSPELTATSVLAWKRQLPFLRQQNIFWNFSERKPKINKRSCF